MDWPLMQDMYLAITRIFDGIILFFANLSDMFGWK